MRRIKPNSTAVAELAVIPDGDATRVFVNFTSDTSKTYLYGPWPERAAQNLLDSRQSTGRTLASLRAAHGDGHLHRGHVGPFEEVMQSYGLKQDTVTTHIPVSGGLSLAF